MQPGQSLPGSFQDGIWLMVPVKPRSLSSGSWLFFPFFVLFFAISSLSLKKWCCHLCGIFLEFTNFDSEDLHALNYIDPRKRNAHTLTQAQGCRPPPLIESTTGPAPLTMEAQAYTFEALHRKKRVGIKRFQMIYKSFSLSRNKKINCKPSSQGRNPENYML